NGVELSVGSGERIGLIGPNGSGKTTLFLCIMGLLKPSSGKISLFGKEMRSERDFRWARRRIGLLFQDPDDQLFCPTVLEDVAFGPLNLGKSPKEAEEIARKTLSFLGLEGLEDRLTYRLSGGEKKLVSMATVLSMEPELLLLDEPTNGLDEETYERIVEILNGLNLTCVFISHDVDFLLNTTHKIYMMQKGRILRDGEMVAHPHVHVHRLGSIHHTHWRLLCEGDGGDE
ncbi:MAG: energy-coupling factor ABC transporter ATP-binding protein, partial [Desulfatiglandales bacterium]